MAGNFREYATRQEMIAARWSIASTDSSCRNCGRTINWAKSPNGKSVPLDPNSTKLHLKSCSGVAPSTSPSTSPPASSSQPANNTSNEMTALRQSMDECAAAVRELSRILRARAEAR